MKNICLIACVVIGWGMAIHPARAQQKTQPQDSLETLRLAQRSADFQLRQAQRQQALRQRAADLQIPLQKQQGNTWLTLRSIAPDGTPMYDVPDNLDAVVSIGADSVKAGGGLGLNLSGAGQTLGIWEAFEAAGTAAVRNTHQEFGGRATVVDAGSFSDHATHVAGTMIAAGVDPDAEGFSAAANLLSYDITNDVAEMDAAAKAATPIRISNHSYGTRTGWSFNNTSGDWDWNGGAANEDWRFGAYEANAQDWDETAYNNPFLTIFKSAGNDRGDGPGTSPAGPEMDGGADGFDCIPTYGTAKNIVTVGAVNDVPGGYSGPGAVFMSSFSGWGPTDDGRIKPDVVANGVALRSSGNAADDDYVDKSGTSMSTPSVSGGAGLLLEHWQNVLGGAPRSATLKGLLIHSADECGAALGPDYSFGWGLANIGDAAQMISLEAVEGCQQYLEGSVGDGEVFSYELYSDGATPLKVTLVWNDVPSPSANGGTLNPAGVRYLVNDLDLRLDYNGATFLPWVLDPANPANPAATGNNNRDNVEQILLLAPAAGLYTIRVVAPGAVQDGPQRFTLWFSGQGADVDHLNVSGVIINDARLYAARQTITFGPLPVAVNPTGNVRAYAGGSVTLQPGFHATAGSRFHARIVSLGGCGQIAAQLKADNYAGFRPMSEMAGEGRSQADFSVQETETVRLWPNPASEWVRVQWTGEAPKQDTPFRVLDQWGRVVLEQNLPAFQTSMDIPVIGLTPGVYVCVWNRESATLVVVR